MQRISETINPARPRKQGAAPPATHATTNRNGGAFTLVELLAVMLILAILVGLVVGVTRHAIGQANRKHTIAIMDIVADAIQAYYDDSAPPHAYPDSLSVLTGNTAAKKVLANLDSETWSGGNTIKDAYGKGLDYEKTGGLGGCPVLISGGRDGFFGKESERPNGLSDPDWERLKKKYKEDNVRSDK